MATQTGELNTVLKNLQRVREGMEAALNEAAEEIAALLQEYAKAHHPWQPDTGETDRTTVAGVIEEAAGVIVIALTTGTPYSKFLELARQGRWSWLWPTIEANQQNMQDILVRHLQAVRL